MRQVLEQRRIAVVRVRNSCVFPAHFQFIAAANPCPCGWRLSNQRDCRCDDGAIARYAARVSGPLLDRIDLHICVAAVAWRELDAPATGPSSREVRERVVAARLRQEQRGAAPGIRTNAEIPDRAIDSLVQATPDARRLLGRAVENLGLSARAARRLLKVARTIADLAGEEKTGPRAMAEALGYRDDTADLR
jgi:magnesium chelatase family protein